MLITKVDNFTAICVQTMNKIYSWKCVCLLCVLCLLACNGGQPESYRIASPDHELVLTISTNPKLTYSLQKGGDIIVAPSEIGITLGDGSQWGSHGKVVARKQQLVDEKVYPLMGKNRELDNKYNELVLAFDQEYSVVFRLYDEGMAYRLCGNKEAGDSLVVVTENASFNLADNPKVILPETANYVAWELSHTTYEGVSDIQEGVYGITPTIFDNKTRDLRLVIAESDLHDYPGMYLRKQDGMMKGHWAAYPKKIEMGSWGNFITVVKEREDYLARTAGNHEFPWRIIVVADDDKKLLTNQLIYLLAKPQQIEDTDWIRPGKATWEWWHCAILEKAPFKSGWKNLSTRMYKYYIDFAAENGIEYLLVDAGWSNVFNHTEMNKNIDIKEVIRYGNEKNVGVFLWTVAATLFQHPHCYLDSISSWGAAGVKIDFFDRDDALVMREYESLAKACAERRLMVDFHGCSKPTGLERAYPNILTYEAVRGAECAKWDTSTNPDYRLEFIFSRQLAGPIDYTPGSMRNTTLEAFKPVDPGLPSTLGTRCHDMALYIILDSYFTMLADSPDEYRKYPDVLKYLSEVPVAWDKTIPLTARLGEYAVLAKQKDRKWYVGGVNAWGERSVSFDFSFLDSGKEYIAELFKDTPESNVTATAYEHTYQAVKANDQFQIDMASGGGFVMIIKEKN